MNAEEILLEVAAILGSAHVPYMVTGSFASSMLGMPRTTRDLDVVVELDASNVDAFLRAFNPSDWYLDPVVVRESLEYRTMFNAIHLESGWKVDFVVRKDRPWSREEFSRRRSLTVSGIPVPFLRAEDSILSKLEWVKLGGSTRQLEDAGTVVDMQGDALDRSYLRTWAAELGVSDLLDRILAG